MTVLAELKRRNIFKVALLYAVSSWLLLQAGDVLFALLGLPDWTLKLVLGILVLGFPAALAISWIYELTPDGLKPAKVIEPEHSIARQTGRKLNKATLVVAGIAIFLVSLQQAAVWEADPGAEAIPAALTSAPAMPVTNGSKAIQTVAVLPFVDLSPASDQAWLGESITAEIQTELSRRPEFRILSRSSSIAVPEAARSAQEIGRALGVQVLVEGTVRRVSDRIRVTMQLVDVESGYQLWSDVHESRLEDDFSAEVAVARFFSDQVHEQLAGPLSAGVQIAAFSEPEEDDFSDLFAEPMMSEGGGAAPLELNNSDSNEN